MDTFILTPHIIRIMVFINIIHMYRENLHRLILKILKKNLFTNALRINLTIKLKEL